MFLSMKPRFAPCAPRLLLWIVGLSLLATMPCQAQAGLFEPGFYATGLDEPTVLAHAGDGSGWLYVTERAGRIRIVDDGSLQSTPFIDLTARIGSTAPERGLLGLAFHPDYVDNGQFFVNYTDLSGDTVVARFLRSANPSQADANSEQVLLTIDQTASNHNGGDLKFGPDGYLYIAVGDGGAKTTREVSQMPERLLGKLLRIDPDGAAPYGIPFDNPFSSNPRAVDGSCGSLPCPEIFSLGLRNPWRIAFDSESGALYIGDVGQWEREEIDRLEGFGSGGQNFGWPCREGLAAFAGDNFPPPAPENCQQSYTDPILDYLHELDRCSVTGGTLYRKPGPHYGKYLYGDYCTGEIFSATARAQGGYDVVLEGELGALLTTFGVDEGGDLYAAGSNGVIRRVANPDGIFVDTFEIRSTVRWDR
jgi:glucose/arabinose dehydrogenase